MTPDPMSRVTATLAYSGWWVSGVLIWLFESRNAYVRFHAAQASVAFGAIAAVVTLLSAMAAASLVFMPPAFAFWMWTSATAWAAGLVLWVVAMWQAATGRAWRIPGAARLADRLCRFEAGPDFV
jgi:uncharacterized membrane protein